jgi:predicted 3-demethylubiquinone-9 3-methyltransferase (glyoxalase superfamily)
MPAKIQPCQWFNKDAEEAAHFYADTFPDSRIDGVTST